MQLRQRKKQDRSNSNNGDFAAKRTILAKVNSKSDFKIGEDSIHFEGEIMSRAYEDKGINYGDKITFTGSSKRFDVLKNRFNEKIEAKIFEGSYVELEGYPSGDGFTFTYFSAYAQPAELNDPSGMPFNTQEVYPEVFTKVHEVQKSRNTDKPYQQVDIFHTEHAIALGGPDRAAAQEIITMTVDELKAMGPEAIDDDFTKDWIARAEKFEELSVFEQAQLVYDYYTFVDEFSSHPRGGYTTVMRIIQIEEDGTMNPDSRVSATLMGRLAKDEQQDAWIQRDFREAIEATLNFIPQGNKPPVVVQPGEEGYVSFETASADIFEAMAPRNKGTEEEIDFGNANVTNLVTMVELMTDPELKEGDNLDQFLIEMIPVARTSTVGDTLKNQGKELAMPYNIKREYERQDGSKAESNTSVIAASNVVLQSFKDPRTKQFQPEKFLAKVQPCELYSKHEGTGTSRHMVEGRATGQVFNTGNLPTPGTRALPAIQEALIKEATNNAARLDPRNQENGNDAPEPEQNNPDDEGMSPGMNG